MIKESLAKWLSRFIPEHFDRIVFAAIVLGLSGVLWLAGKQDEAINVLMLVIGAFMPKIRAPKDK